MLQKRTFSSPKICRSSGWRHKYIRITKYTSTGPVRTRLYFQFKLEDYGIFLLPVLVFMNVSSKNPEQFVFIQFSDSSYSPNFVFFLHIYMSAIDKLLVLHVLIEGEIIIRLHCSCS